jgi:hypothetical protein
MKMQNVVREIMIALQMITLDAMSSVSVDEAMIKFEPVCTTYETHDRSLPTSDKQKNELRYMKKKKKRIGRFPQKAIKAPSPSFPTWRCSES